MDLRVRVGSAAWNIVNIMFLSNPTGHQFPSSQDLPTHPARIAELRSTATDPSTDGWEGPSGRRISSSHSIPIRGVVEIRMPNPERKLQTPNERVGQVMRPCLSSPISLDHTWIRAMFLIRLLPDAAKQFIMVSMQHQSQPLGVNLRRRPDSEGSCRCHRTSPRFPGPLSLLSDVTTRNRRAPQPGS